MPITQIRSLCASFCLSETADLYYVEAPVSVVVSNAACSEATHAKVDRSGPQQEAFGGQDAGRRATRDDHVDGFSQWNVR